MPFKRHDYYLITVLKNGYFTYKTRNIHGRKYDRDGYYDPTTHNIEKEYTSNLEEYNKGLDQDRKGYLQAAIEMGRSHDLINQLLQSKDSNIQKFNKLSYQDTQKNNAIHTLVNSSRDDSTSLLNMLLEEGTDAQKALEQENRQGDTPIVIAIRHKQWALVDSMLAYQYQCGNGLQNKLHPLGLACRYGRYDLVKTLIKQLPQDNSLNIEELSQPIAKLNNNTLLHQAAYSGNLKLIKYLSKHQLFDFDISETNNQGKTPEMKAISRGHYRAACEISLLNGNKQVYQEHKQDITLLQGIVDNSNSKAKEDKIWGNAVNQFENRQCLAATKKLCGYFNQRITLTDEEEHSLGQEGEVSLKLEAIASACLKGNTSLVEKRINSLIENPSFDKLQLVKPLENYNQNTILHLAAKSGSAKLVNYLLTHECISFDLAAKNTRGLSPKQVAVSHQNYRCAALIYDAEKTNKGSRSQHNTTKSLLKYIKQREEKPQHYTVFGRWFGQPDKEQKQEAAAKQICRFFNADIQLTRMDIKCLSSGKLKVAASEQLPLNEEETLKYSN